LEARLQLLKETLFNNIILGRTVSAEDVVGQRTRKRRLGIMGLAIRLHALDTPSTLPVAL
jgi:hypothetical protein